jgi:hypothetical protein
MARTPATRIAAIDQSLWVDTVIDPDLQSAKRRQSAAICTAVNIRNLDTNAKLLEKRVEQGSAAR